MNDYIVCDLEWSVHNTVGGNKGSAFCNENFVVLTGMLQDGVTTVTPENKHIVKMLDSYSGTLVGVNFKSDLHWLRKCGFGFREFVARGGKIWSCDIAEYILTAQEHKFASLDELSAKYGGTQKDTRLKELWDAGVQTEDMDSDMLASYLTDDLLNTEKVYLGQLEAAKASGQLPLIGAMMDAALAVAEIEWNGMPVDLKELEKQTIRLNGLRAEAAVAALDCLDASAKTIPWNLNSNRQLSAALFGGTVEWEEKEEAGVWKSGVKQGQPRYKKIPWSQTVQRQFDPEPHWKTAVEGVWSVADDVLEALEARGSLLAKALRRFRALDKEFSTYAESLPKLIHADGRVHPNLHQTSTNTGRLSSSEPNLQNQPTGSEIKRVFGSRYPEGRLLSLDFKQLEVVALAFLSGDRQLTADLLDGKDIHNAVGETLFPGKTMTKEERRTVKTVVFGLCYGGGAKTLSIQAGITQDLAQQVIETFYCRYPEVREYHSRVVREVEEGAFYTGDRTTNGSPARRSYLKGPTGRRYLFVENDAPDWCRTPVNFIPTKPKNYPIQGFATGDIVPLVLGRMFRLMCKGPIGHEARLVNTIHDSIVVDCKTEADAKWIGKHLQIEAEAAPSALLEVFGIDFPLPLAVSTTSGNNWYEVDQE